MPARLGHGFVVFGVAALVVKALACVDLESLGNGPPRDAAPETANDDAADGAAAGDPCAHVGPPGPPSTDDAPGEELPPFVLAIDVATLDPAKAPGFDLDGVCTCDSRAGTAADGGPSCASRPNVVCDGDGGTDNTIATVAQVAAANGIDRAVARLIASGERTLLLRLAQYNGRANDPEVAVGAILAEGIRTKTCADSMPSGDAGTWTPGKCGDDTWTLSSDSVSSTGVPAVIGKGFVHDYRLVVPRFALPVTLPFTGDTVISFHEAIVSGRLVPLDANLQPRDASRAPLPAEERLYRIEDGLLAGRAKTGDVLSAIGHYPWSAGGGPLCNQSVFPFVRQTICESADIALQPSAPANDACDALSAGVGFVAIPARPGAIVPSPPPPTACAAADGGALACP